MPGLSHTLCGLFEVWVAVWWQFGWQLRDAMLVRLYHSKRRVVVYS